MLEGLDANMIDTQGAPDTLRELHDFLARLQGELKFQKTRNEALNFEIARLKRWRFGSSSESLDSSTQAVLLLCQPAHRMVRRATV